MTSKQPTILVIFGISGDLAGRYSLPAIGKIADAGMLPDKFKIVGVTRKPDVNLENLLAKAENKSYLRDHIELFRMDVTKSADYEKLNDHLEAIEKTFSGPAERLFYLSIPPEASQQIVDQIGKSSLVKNKTKKLLIEKPFGTNLENAEELVKHIGKYFTEEEVYRVDHYMAKEMAQNIVVFRNGNSLFKRTWNRDFIESIKIIASEKIDIDGRVHFYEQTGALRDYVQSHLLQMLALILMELPEEQKFEQIPELRYRALKQLSIICDISHKECVKRGQYEGYRDEVKKKESMMETFVSISLASNDERWRGVPITIATGKAMKERFTEIRIRYKKDKDNEANELLLRIQPDAGIELGVWTKMPGYKYKLKKEILHFNFKEQYEKLPEAYEQVLFNVISSDHNLFISSREVLESWRILKDVQDSWKSSGDDLIIYKKGSSIEEI